MSTVAHDLAVARAAADLNAGINWWVRPGVFDTRTWDGEVVVGGRWRTTGVGPRGPYELTGCHREIEPSRRLVHCWEAVEFPDAASTVTYDLTPAAEDGTRVTLRHQGLARPVVPSF